MSSDLNYTVSIYDGCVIDTDSIWICGKVDSLDQDDYSHSFIYGYGNGVWGQYPVPFMTTSVCVYRPKDPAPAPRAMCSLADIHGCVDFYWAKGVKKEVEQLPGSDRDGSWLHLTQIIQVGDDLFVAGNGGNVFRRTFKGGWVLFSEGLETPPLETFMKAGRSQGEAVNLMVEQSAMLTSIDGTGHDNLYSVSRYGVVYHKADGPWRSLEQVTNVTLHRVKVVDDKTVYAVGHKGVLLKGNANGFKVIPTGINDNLWGLEWYKGKLYIGAQSKGLFVYDGKTFAHVATPKLSFECHTLNAYAGQLLALGSKDIFLTSDGVHWREIKNLDAV